MALRHSQRPVPSCRRAYAPSPASALVPRAPPRRVAAARPFVVVGAPLASQARPVRGQHCAAVEAASNSVPPSMASIDATGEASMQISVDNTSDAACTTIRIVGPGQSDCLLLLVNTLFSEGYRVHSSQFEEADGLLNFTLRVAGRDGKQARPGSEAGRQAGLSDVQVAEARELIERVVSTSSMSVRPAIYGMVAERELERLESTSPDEAMSDALELERAATEVAVAASKFAAAERRVQAAAQKKDAAKQASAERERSEAASVLERAIAAIEALVISRRQVGTGAPAEEPRSAADVLKAQMEAAAVAPPQQVGTGPAAGSGYEILLQAFNWESHKKGTDLPPLYVAARAKEWADEGFTAVWLPPPSDSVSPQGYLPRDLYQLNSAYGTEGELRAALSALHEHGVKAIADIVINHRCASFQGDGGKWNKFGGRLAWDSSAICNNNPAWGGRGGRKTGDDYPAAPNIDHTQERIRADITEWLRYLKTVGFDGWRFDFVRGYGGQYIKQYIDATVPQMAFGEFWDTCEYSGSVLNYNQDAHRQRTVNWCDSTGGTAAAFDFTTKGVLQEALGRGELWRLVDARGRPPGLVGMWSSRAITFIDNHDTGSTLNHWPFPSNHLQEGYAYILTHPGTPCVFVDHINGDGKLRKLILELLRIRKDAGVNARSKVAVRRAAPDVYAATIDDRVAVKLGAGAWSPNDQRACDKEWRLSASGQNVAVWTVSA
ncbi:glycoside hydrolase [Raphidocelis subcapitata]|uniref:Alpha-amylase n=1 Tax=Raphidocelis subcapitata TaxID=307507 RepID=A0A2V0PJE3_9CHLO|nr:glycoside hydrolase [Raphidocelis subcapitata]|eukprot:GBF99921.1 glycoside hydrolase [Raphidocelis subcapitata]